VLHPRAETFVELSPLDVIELEAYYEPFCTREAYNPNVCDLTCGVCRDLLIAKGGTA
jgi:hypothetical protein